MPGVPAPSGGAAPPRPPLLLVLAFWGQGIYYVITGLWPLISMRLFEAVTGPKTDDWLVQTVGLLVLCTGALLLFSAARRSFPVQMILLAAGNALALAAVDIVLSLSGVISPIYLADALPEIALAVVYAVTGPRLHRTA